MTRPRATAARPWLLAALCSCVPVASRGADAPEHPFPLRADYGLGAPKVTPAALGLKPKEVLLANFSETGRWKGKHAYDELTLKMAVQGMINRHGPLVYLDNSIWGWQGDRTWLTYYHAAHGYTFAKLDGGLGALIRRVAPVFRGIVLYEPQPSDNTFLALNLASLNFCLPVSRRLYALHKARFAGLPVVARIEKNRLTRTAAYDWMIANLLPRTDRTCAYCPASSFGDITLSERPWEAFIIGADYPFYRRSFLYNISSQPFPIGRISGSPAMFARFEAIMRGLERPAAIFGWCVAEAEFSTYGHYQCCSTAAPNLSFHAAVPPLKPPPYRQDTRPKLTRPEEKVYLAFVANEGDTAVVITQHYYGGWHDPGRGKIPLNWAINPVYAKLFPAVVEYFFRTRTRNDYFVCGPSGAGYVHPDRMPPAYLDAFLDHTAACLRDGVNLREIVLWEARKPSVRERYARKLPGLRGLTVKPNGLYPRGELLFTGHGTIPVVREGEGHYWQTKKRFFGPGYTLKVPAAVAFLEDLHAHVRKPHFLMVYGLQNNIPSELVKLAAALDPGKFQFVDCATFFHLARQTAPLRWSSGLLRQAGPWAGWNGALVSASERGLRVEVAPGRKWAIAALVNAALPADARAIRVRVGAVHRGRWVVKVSGPLGEDGWRADWVPFGDRFRPGQQARPLDKRVRAAIVLRQPLTLQLGLSGSPGAAVVFEGLDFPRQTE